MKKIKYILASLLAVTSLAAQAQVFDITVKKSGETSVALSSRYATNATLQLNNGTLKIITSTDTKQLGEYTFAEHICQYSLTFKNYPSIVTGDGSSLPDGDFVAKAPRRFVESSNTGNQLPAINGPSLVFEKKTAAGGGIVTFALANDNSTITIKTDFTNYIVNSGGSNTKIAMESVNKVYFIDAHNLTFEAEKSPTCVQPGNTDYYYCSTCKKYFSDAQCTTEVQASAVLIPATSHNYGSDDLCTVCGAFRMSDYVVDKSMLSNCISSIMTNAETTAFTLHFIDNISSVSNVSEVEALNGPATIKLFKNSTTTDYYIAPTTAGKVIYTPADCSGMFADATKLSSINLENFNTYLLKDVSNMFNGCSNLVTIKVSRKFSTEKVTNSNNMFAGCTSLKGYRGTTYDANHVDKTYAHIDGGKANSGYFSFSDVVLDVEQYWAVVNKDNNENVYGKPEEIYAKLWTSLSFVYHEDLPENVTEVSSLNTAGTLKLYRDATTTTKFYVAPSTDGTVITANEIHATANNIKKDQNSHGIFESNVPLTEINLNNFVTYGCTDLSCLFKNCIKLTTVSFGEHFNTANVTDMNNMFYWCHELPSLDISGFNTANVTKMNGMFDGCYKLASLNLSNINTAQVTDMSRMFWQCEKLEQIDFSKFNTANVTNMSGMFAACNVLTSIDLTKLNTANVTDMSDMFSSCSALTSLNLASLNTDKVTNMSGMFSYTLFTSLDLSQFNTADVTDMSSMFEGCTQITSLDLSSFNTENVKNMKNMFKGCTQLTSLTLDNFDMEKVNTYDGMFCDVNKENVTLTVKSLPYIKSGALVANWKDVIFELSDNSTIFIGCTNYPDPTQSPTYTRAMTNSWGTAVLPFQVNVVNNSEVTFYTLTEVDCELGESAEGTLTFTAREENDSIMANTPFVFRKNNAAATSVTFVGEKYKYDTYEESLWDDVKSDYVYDKEGNIITNTVTSKNLCAPYANYPEPVDLINGLTMYGTYGTESIVSDDEYTKYFIASNKFWRADVKTTVKKFRAWFETPFSNASTFRIIFEDKTDGISQLNAESLKQNEGKFIDNGKIVIIRNGKKYNINGQIIK